MRLTRCLLCLICFCINAGCVYSHRTYSMHKNFSDMLGCFPYDRADKNGVVQTELVGYLKKDYQRHGLFGPESEITNPLLPLLCAPLSLLFEWNATTDYAFTVKCGSELSGSKFMRFQYAWPGVGVWRKAAELCCGDGTNIVARVAMWVNRATKNEWRYKFTVAMDGKDTDYWCPYLDHFPRRHDGNLSMVPYGSDSILIVRRVTGEDYQNYFWKIREDGGTEMLIKFNFKTGEFTRMLWFWRGLMRIADDLDIETEMKSFKFGPIRFW